MDWFDGSSVPSAYQEVEWIADLGKSVQGLGWTINYSLMVYQSFRDRTYGMSILPLCSNFAWEFVYTFIYPSDNLAEKVVISMYMILNFLVIYSAIKFAHREWEHSPFVQRNIPWIFLVAIGGFISGHIALAQTMGAGLGASWGAYFCLEFLCVGAWCQLISRGSSRGTSQMIWLSRFVGSYVTILTVWLRGVYWPEAFSWVLSPLAIWHIASCMVMDIGYFFFLRHIQRKEREEQKQK